MLGLALDVSLERKGVPVRVRYRLQPDEATVGVLERVVPVEAGLDRATTTFMVEELPRGGYVVVAQVLVDGEVRLDRRLAITLR